MDDHRSMITTVTQKNMVTDRAERARRLLGASRQFSPQRDAVAELVAERGSEG